MLITIELPMTWKYYPKPFDNTRPPPCPPNQTGRMWPFIGFVQTKDSKRESQEYAIRLDKYDPTWKADKC